MIDQNDLAAGTEHPRKFVERAFRIGNGGNHILRDHHIEHSIGQRQMRGIHHRQRIDIGEVLLAHPLLRLAQHRRGDVDPNQPVAAGIVRQ